MTSIFILIVLEGRVFSKPKNLLSYNDVALETKNIKNKKESYIKNYNHLLKDPETLLEIANHYENDDLTQRESNYIESLFKEVENFEIKKNEKKEKANEFKNIVQEKFEVQEQQLEISNT